MKKEKLRLEDLKVGMRVYVKQLSDIYNVFIYLSDFKYDEDAYDTVGTISYFGSLSVEEAGFRHEDVCVVYNILENEGLDYE